MNQFLHHEHRKHLMSKLTCFYILALFERQWWKMDEKKLKLSEKVQTSPLFVRKKRYFLHIISQYKP